MTANLQSGLTVKQAAVLMNVSERMIYMARELDRTGREDLCREVEAGRLTILAALKKAKPDKYDKRRSGLSLLRSAWNNATPDERALFAAEVRKAIWP